MTHAVIADEAGGGRNNYVGLILGLALALGLQLIPAPGGLSREAWIVASLVILMAVWWVTEALPLAVTSLIPLVALPLLVGISPRDAAAPYANPILYVFLGGFLLAIAIERWRLNARIAYGIVAATGPRPRLIVAGFIVATALVSMWISNTATALMMTPLALAVAAAASPATAGKGGDADPFGQALVLGVCYAASIGGIGTPVGSPTNLIAMAWLTENTGKAVDFGAWMMIGVPAVLLLLPVAWFLTARNLKSDKEAGKAAQQEVHSALAGLGRITVPEVRVGVVFGLVAFLWVFADPIKDLTGLNGLEDMTVAILGAIALFLIPAGGGEKRSLLVWDDAVKVPWGIILMFGGGLSIAEAATKTGLAAALGLGLEGVGVLPPLLLLGLVILVMIVLTEFASNVATITLMLPILGALAVATGLAPVAIVVPAAIAASCGFMMPAGTAPNAIAYSTGKLTIPLMMRRGLMLNVVSVVVLTAVGLWIAPAALQ